MNQILNDFRRDLPVMLLSGVTMFFIFIFLILVAAIILSWMFVAFTWLSDSAWRERIGNAVPPPAAQAIAGVMGQTLLLAWSGETFVLDAMPIWVQPVAVAVALSVVGGAV